jgi:hypothetical protein
MVVYILDRLLTYVLVVSGYSGIHAAGRDLRGFGGRGPRQIITGLPRQI